jgi:hypothetical protein
MSSLSPIFDIVRQPPAVIPGSKLAGLFKALQAQPDNIMERTYTELLAILDISRDHKLSQTGLELARLIDQDSREQGQANYGGHGNHYHNRNHMLEVMVSAALLLQIHEREKFQPELTRLDKLFVLTAALGHDLGHDGYGNGMGPARVALLNETRSVKLAEPVMAKKFGPYRPKELAEATEVYRALIVSTDIGGGSESPARVFIEKAAHLRGERAEPPTVDTPERLYFSDLMDSYPHLAEMSCLLQDADLMPATSITPEWVMRQERTLAEEVSSRLTDKAEINWSAALWFQRNLADPKSLAGKTFALNHERTQAYVQKQADAQKGLTPD